MILVSTSDIDEKNAFVILKLYRSNLTNYGFGYKEVNTTACDKKIISQNSRIPTKIQNGKSLIKENQMLKHIKGHQTNNLHIPDLIQAFSYVENGRFNLVL